MNKLQRCQKNTFFQCGLSQDSLSLNHKKQLIFHMIHDIAWNPMDQHQVFSGWIGHGAIAVAQF